ncbi:MAG: PEP-CTERM system histidine kinase PrsK, partial [Sphingomonadales bacterium]|nr:PEP-CTERM system histidine kinase PrsK [Sphingomonadales bacterium]
MAPLAGLSEILSALALAAFSGVTLWLLARPRARMAVLMPAPRWLAIASAATALWCAALYVWTPGSSEALVAQTLRDLAMLGWLRATFWSPAAPMSRPLRLVLRLLVTTSAMTLLVGFLA